MPQSLLRNSIIVGAAGLLGLEVLADLAVYIVGQFVELKLLPPVSANHHAYLITVLFVIVLGAVGGPAVQTLLNRLLAGHLPPQQREAIGNIAPRGLAA